MFDHYYSDSHFGHENIIKFCNRPYANADEMTTDMIDRYNRHVRQEDLVLWCGDAFLKMPAEEAKLTLTYLKGRKAIVLGNHDKPAAWFLEQGFVFALDEIVFHIGRHMVHACHFPIVKPRIEGEDEEEHERYDTRFAHLRPILRKGEWLIHGHTHDPRKVTGERMIHVGVDAWDYRPVARDEVLDIIQKYEAAQEELGAT